jgi:murein tripeptide amidase MpaA
MRKWFALIAFTLLALPAFSEPIAPLPFDRILHYDELTTLLRSWQTAKSNLVEMESIGNTPQNRPLWFLTITNKSTGPASTKPAIVVDGNMHATEWGGGVAALHFVWTLLKGYGTDARITRLLDTRTIYVLPRMTPDGVESTLAQGRFIRSVDRPYPYSELQPGIHASDIDGDGRSVFMRYRDPNGPWKVSTADPRLMVPRGADEVGGDYWRVLPEGMITDYNGVTIGDPYPNEPLDFGANFPADLGTAAPGITSGPYPTSEPEVAAYVRSIAKRPNIVAHVTCHTFGGLILTPPVNVGEQVPTSDRHIYEIFATKGGTLTGYRAMSYLDLRSEGREAYIPSAFGWLYNRRGIYSFITEFWNPLKAAGISTENVTESAWLFGFHSVEDEMKLLRWSDKELGGQGFVPWKAFKHPQLGQVEVGGFDLIRYWYNIPFDRLEKEVAPHTEWLIWLGLTTAQLHVRSFTAESIGTNVWRVRLVVENMGWLPSNGSQQAVDQQIVMPVDAELKVSANARIMTGKEKQQLGQLAGRSGQRSTATWWGYTAGTPDRGLAEWIVAAPAGTALSANVTSERGGSAQATMTLEAH